MPSFLSSTYPLLFLDEAKEGKFHKGRKSIAEILKKFGYETAAIHSNPYISKFYGYDRGFDYFNDFLLGQVEDEIERNKISKIIHETIKGVKAVFIHKLPHEDGERINEEAIKWLEKANEPFFLWLHYMDVHMPYVPSNRFLEELGLKKYSHIKKIWMGKKIDDAKMRKKIKNKEVPDYINLYDGCIRYTDWAIQSLIRKIGKNFSETLFLITADHGEEFREHGGLGHEEKLYDELLHVPLIFYGKDIEKGRIKKPVSLIGLVPTIFYFLGLKENEWFQGKNLFESEKYIISEAWKNEMIIAYRDDKWKFIVSKERKELYNLKEDVMEQKNLYGIKEYKEKCKEFEKIINNHIKMLEEERRKRKTWLQKEKIKRAMRRIRI
ncbi:hypothetical protein B6U81_07575 [Thermoplasmatales archaeon ex4484_30]|nr:MAG: hypothetical protein B6U81_07575 [Thermoplasmatales archaeon ex4484_30]